MSGKFKAVAAGVVKGYEDGALRPKETISRVEALVLLSRCLPKLGALRDATAFRDVPAWAKADIDRFSAAGLVAGYGGGVLGANDALSVGQVGALTARVLGGDLLGAVIQVNSAESCFARHSNAYWQDTQYSEGKAVGVSKYFTSPQFVCLNYANESSISYITSDSSFRYQPDADEACVRLLLTPEENAANLAWYQSVLYTSEEETLESVQEQDGELLITTYYTDPDLIRGELEMYRGFYGEKFKTTYEDGMKEFLTYRVDAITLEVKGFAETLRLADGSEEPLLQTSYAYDVEFPAPAADSRFAPAFDGSKGYREITVVFDPGTDEEQTHTYSVPNTIKARIYYHDAFRNLYDDLACTIPVSSINGRTAFTVYVSGKD